MSLRHPLVLTSQHTCGACPDQYQGRLLAGQTFYYRYRCGLVSLGIGPDLDAAVGDPHATYQELGDALDGVFPDDQTRDEVFHRLLMQRLAG